MNGARIAKGFRRVAAAALAAGLLATVLAGCSSAPKRPEGRASESRQCGEFCRKLDACLGGEFDDALKDRMCELARCESGCRPRVRAAAGYEGAFQFASGTWRAVCGPIFARRGLERCRPTDARNDLCCAAVCTAEMFSAGGAGHWPVCGR
ncbi:MAG: transglycosylase family protein [Bdellovibrionales bacterium]|nr:transglycosylase family protein [Bdellovibrionales bacterium]